MLGLADSLSSVTSFGSVIPLTMECFPSHYEYRPPHRAVVWPYDYRIHVRPTLSGPTDLPVCSGHMLRYDRAGTGQDEKDNS